MELLGSVAPGACSPRQAKQARQLRRDVLSLLGKSIIQETLPGETHTKLLFLVKGTQDLEMLGGLERCLSFIADRRSTYPSTARQREAVAQKLGELTHQTLKVVEGGPGQPAFRLVTEVSHDQIQGESARVSAARQGVMRIEMIGADRVAEKAMPFVAALALPTEIALAPGVTLLTTALVAGGLAAAEEVCAGVPLRTAFSSGYQAAARILCLQAANY